MASGCTFTLTWSSPSHIFRVSTINLHIYVNRKHCTQRHTIHVQMYYLAPGQDFLLFHCRQIQEPWRNLSHHPNSPQSDHNYRHHSAWTDRPSAHNVSLSFAPALSDESDIDSHLAARSSSSSQSFHATAAWHGKEHTTKITAVMSSKSLFMLSIVLMHLSRPCL